MAGPKPKLREMFSEAVQFQTAAEQAAYLEQACQGDAELRAQLEELLQAHREAGSFLQEPSATRAATVDGPAVLEQPGAVIGPYKLLQQIGEGGMGTVYMAEQTQPVQRKVALKVIKAGMDSGQVIARFEAERQALALMDHPNIAKVLDAGTTSAGRPYFVMELVKGVPITMYCDENHLPPKARLELFGQVCQAVQHAHQKGIIHRDIKPTNVLVTLYDDKPVPKVIDFGVAKATGGRLTERTMFTGYGQIVGTIEYMSPEQARLNSLDIDTRGDIYSLGVLLYELLTGTTPFDKQRLREAAFDEMLRMIREDEPPKPSTRLSTTEGRASIAANRSMEPHKLSGLVRGELDWIVMKALEKDRNRRYETANGLAMDVQRYLADEQVLACPPSPGYRFRKMVRRNKTLITTMGLVSLALVLGTIISAWQAIRATRAEIEMAAQRDAAAIAEARATKNALAAEQARAEAIANLQKAHQAVDQMLTEVGSVDLADVPQMEPVRRALMEKALKFYQGFLDERSRDPSTRDGAGDAYRRMAWIYRVLGKHSEAEKALRQGVSLFAGLVADFPAVPDYRVNLAETQGQLASTLLHLGRPGEAEESYRQTYELRRHLAAEFPENLTYLQGQAGAADALGGILAHRGRRIEAGEAFQEAYTLLEKLGDDPVRIELTKATAAGNAGRPAEAKQHFRQALEMLQTQSAASPHNPMLRFQLAQTQLRLGLKLENVAERSELERIVRESISHSSQLVTDFPNTAQYRAGLVEAYHHLLLLLEANDQLADAEQAYRQSLPHVEKLVVDGPDRRWYWELLQKYLLFYADLLSATSRPQEAQQAYRQALATSRKMLSQFPDDPKVLRVAVHSYHKLETSLLEAGRLPEAEQVCREALSDWTKLSKTYAAEKGFQTALLSAHALLVSILKDSGQKEKLEQAYRQSIELYGAIAGEHAQVADVFRPAVVNAYRQLGKWLKDRGRLAEYFNVLDTLASRFPEQPEYRLQLSAAHHEQAETLVRTNRSDEADVEYRKALEAAERAAADCADSASAWTMVGHRSRSLAWRLRQLKRVAEAESLHAQGVRAFDIAITLPGAKVDECRFYAARTRRSQADLALAQQRMKEAGELYAQSIAGYCTLQASTFQNAERRVTVNGDIAHVVQFLTAQKQPEDALAVYGQAIDLYSRLCEALPAESAFAEQLTRLRDESAKLAKEHPR